MARILIIVGLVMAAAMLFFASLGPGPNSGGKAEGFGPPPDVAWFRDKTVNNPLPVLVEFGATWCGPCRMIDPLLDQLKEDYAGRLDVVKVDVDQWKQIAAHYQVSGIPRLFILQQGEVVAMQDGVLGRTRDDIYQDLKDFVTPYLREVPLDATPDDGVSSMPPPPTEESQDF